MIFINDEPVIKLDNEIDTNIEDDVSEEVIL